MSTDPIVWAARFIADNLEWLRHATDGGHEPYAVRAFAEIDWCAGRMRGLVNGPSEQKYLGPCGALVVLEYERSEVGGVLHESATTGTCEGDIYGPRGGSKGTCRTCGATVAQAERQKWLDEKAQSSGLAWTAIGIADAYGISVKTIRSWATERRAPNGTVLRQAKLATYWHNGEQLVPWVDPLPGQDVKARGDRLHYVADVKALADEAAQRRTEEQTRRVQHGEAA